MTAGKLSAGVAAGIASLPRIGSALANQGANLRGTFEVMQNHIKDHMRIRGLYEVDASFAKVADDKRH